MTAAGHEPTQQIATRYRKSIVARLDALAAAERRDRSDVLRLLVEDGLPARERAVGIPTEDGQVSGRIKTTAPPAGRTTVVASHPYKPQPGNALKCETCGGKKGDHR